ncbi:MAG: histidine kinase, partial [Eubacteriales bacterium]|nr:histidine kinase [Eubacteriales bacterium]MDD3883196.1 histidine kinase [Eubacteriales bacterium]
VAVIAFAYCAVQFWRDIHKPLRTLVSAFGAVKHGDLSTRIHHDRNDEFADIYKSFNHMSGRLESLIEQMYKQKIRTQQAELRQLQSQINPHFLYNSFFMIKAFSRMGDCDSIERITDGLGEYFRYVTRNGEDEVALEQEIRHAKSYASVQDMRFSTRISLEFPDVPDEIAKVIVPRLVVQPIIENAYSHGLSQITDKGALRVSYSYDDGFAYVTVEDSGSLLDDDALLALQKQLSEPEPAETTGLINIHRRLMLRFGTPCGLELSRSELGGLMVTMTLKRGEERK